MHVARVSLASLAFLASLAGGAAGARADVSPEVELAAGASQNLGSQAQSEYYDTSTMLGLRGVGYLGATDASPFRFGVELAVDVMHYGWLPRSDFDAFGTDPDALRERVLGGTRVEWRLSPLFQLFGRALVGVDHYATDDPDDLPEGAQSAPWFGASASAFAAELGGGARFTLGHLVLGLQCDVPVAFYSSEPPHRSYRPGEPFIWPDRNVHYLLGTMVEVEGLLTVGVAF